MNIPEQPESSSALRTANLVQLTVPGRNPDHTIPLDLLDNDLAVEITDSEDIAVGDTLTLFVEGEEHASSYTVTGADKENAQGDPAFRYTLSYSADEFPEQGKTKIVSLDYAVNALPSGRPLEVILDLEPPGGSTLPYLSFTPEQLDGISPSDLTDGALRVRAPFWYGKKAGDVITPWLGTSEESGTLIDADAVTVEQPQDAIEVPFSKAQLLSNGDVTQYFAYQLRDALGNLSDISRRRAIDVSLTQSRTKQKKRSVKSARSLQIFSIGILDLPSLIRPVGTFDDGTLPIALLTAPLEFKIKNGTPQDFPEEGEIQLIRLEEGGSPTKIGPPHTITAAESQDPNFEYTLRVPVADFPANGSTTPWLMSYTVYDPLSDATGESKFPQKIIFDREPPGGKLPVDMPLLEFTEDQLSGITLADVVGDSIPVMLPAWYLGAKGDVVQLWLGTSDGSGNYLADTFTLGDGGDGLEVKFKVSDIEPLGNATLYFGYRITDKAGNQSARSNTVGIPVLLKDAPTNLRAPVVPDFLDHLVITQKDAAELVEVEIPDFTNAMVGDIIRLKWGNRSISPVSLTAGDLNPTPPNPLKVIRIPYADVLAEGSGIGKRVIYEVVRANLTADISPPATVDVDLDSPGPDPDPDPTTPWHENLVPLNVKSASGADNEIPPGDFNKAATATVPHLGKDGKVIWKSGDRVEVSWDGVLTPPVPISTANQNRDLVVPIPAGTVGASTGIKDVFYIVSRDLPLGSQVATAEAEPTKVNVQSPGLLPGDGALAVAVFPEEIIRLNAINTKNPDGTGVGGLDGTPVRIPLAGVTNVGVDDLISLKFVGHTGTTLPIGPEIPGTDIIVNDYKITAQDLARGYYERDIPYNPYLQKICRNGATLNYSIANRTGRVDATQKFIRIALDVPGKGCAINP